MGVASLHRTVDRLLARVGESEEGSTRGSFDPSRLSDEQFEELDRLLEGVRQDQGPGGGGWVDGRLFSPEERERVRGLLERMFTGPPGTTRVLPWLLTDTELNRLDALCEKARNPRTGSPDPDRLSEDERREYAEISGRVRVVAGIDG